MTDQPVRPRRLEFELRLGVGRWEWLGVGRWELGIELPDPRQFPDIDRGGAVDGEGNSSDLQNDQDESAPRPSTSQTIPGDRLPEPAHGDEQQAGDPDVERSFEVGAMPESARAVSRSRANRL